MGDKRFFKKSDKYWPKALKLDGKQQTTITHSTRNGEWNNWWNRPKLLENELNACWFWPEAWKRDSEQPFLGNQFQTMSSMATTAGTGSCQRPALQPLGSPKTALQHDFSRPTVGWTLVLAWVRMHCWVGDAYTNARAHPPTYAYHTICTCACIWLSTYLCIK